MTTVATWPTVFSTEGLSFGRRTRLDIALAEGRCSAAR